MHIKPFGCTTSKGLGLWYSACMWLRRPLVNLHIRTVCLVLLLRTIIFFVGSSLRTRIRWPVQTHNSTQTEFTITTWKANEKKATRVDAIRIGAFDTYLFIFMLDQVHSIAYVWTYVLRFLLTLSLSLSVSMQCTRATTQHTLCTMANRIFSHKTSFLTINEKKTQRFSFGYSVHCVCVCVFFAWEFLVDLSLYILYIIGWWCRGRRHRPMENHLTVSRVQAMNTCVHREHNSE